MRMAVRVFLSSGGHRTVDAADSARLDGPSFLVRRWYPDLNRTETVLTLRSEDVIGAEVLKNGVELTTFRGAGRPRHEPSRTSPRTSHLITFEYSDDFSFRRTRALARRKPPIRV
jgi:hypothetical protein